MGARHEGGIIGFALIFSFAGCLLGAAVGQWLSPEVALVIGVLSGVESGWSCCRESIGLGQSTTDSLEEPSMDSPPMTHRERCGTGHHSRSGVSTVAMLFVLSGMIVGLLLTGLFVPAGIVSASFLLFAILGFWATWTIGRCIGLASSHR